MLSADTIVNLHDRQTQAWHQSDENAALAGGTADAWLQAVERQHRANFDLWHIEDEARAPGATDAEIAKVKRKIDRTNQLRNDLAEELDLELLRWLEPQHLPEPHASLNSNGTSKGLRFS